MTAATILYITIYGVILYLFLNMILSEWRNRD
jgi:hypothetical protein